MEDAPLTLLPTETAASASPHHVIVLLFSGPMAAGASTHLKPLLIFPSEPRGPAW